MNSEIFSTQNSPYLTQRKPTCYFVILMLFSIGEIAITCATSHIFNVLDINPDTYYGVRLLSQINNWEKFVALYKAQKPWYIYYLSHMANLPAIRKRKGKI